MRNYCENFIRVAIILSMVAMLMGCGSKSFVEGGYDTLDTANTTVHELMKHLGKKYQQGELSQAKREQITDIYLKYKAASDAADTALATYARTGDELAKEDYLVVLGDVLRYRKKFINLAKTFMN